MRTIPIKLVLTFILVTCVAFSQPSQNTEFSFIIGPTSSTTQSFTGSNVTVSSPGSAFYRQSIAHQIVSVGPGDLYFELPTTFAFSTSGSTSTGPRISGGNVFLITPGVRYKLPLRFHLSLFGLLGGGYGMFGGYELNPTPADPSAVAHSLTAGLVGDFGGGVDLRLNRLLSVRGEIRDFVSRPGLGGISGRNHISFGFGVALHH